MHIENRLDKKILEYEKEVDMGRLMEELYEAIPELSPKIYSNNTFEISLRIFTNGSKLILWVPEEMNEEPINAVVESYQAVIYVEEGEM